jgi:hypothetical protein
MKTQILIMREARQELGIQRETLTDLVRKLEIIPKDVPYNGNAKGLDQADMRRIRRALNMPARSARQAQPA